MYETYRSFVGKAEKFDLLGAQQFNLLFILGLRETDYLLDIGCGSLAAGRLFIPYLLPGRYYGIEPEEWLISEGLSKELGKDIIDIKKPVFSNDSNFTLSSLNREFDYILAHSIFTHTSQNQIMRCLSEAKKIMKPTSLFIATFAKGKQNYSGEKWVYPGFVTYTFDLMKNLFIKNGLICKTINWSHPDFQTWIIAKLKNEAHDYDQENMSFNKFDHEVSTINNRIQETRETLLDLFLEY